MGGGLGGIFGPAYALGKPLPFPEANPWKPSKRYRALMLVGQLASWLQKKKHQPSYGSGGCELGARITGGCSGSVFRVAYPEGTAISEGGGQNPFDRPENVWWRRRRCVARIRGLGYKL